MPGTRPALVLGMSTLVLLAASCGDSGSDSAPNAGGSTQNDAGAGKGGSTGGMATGGNVSSGGSQGGGSAKGGNGGGGKGGGTSGGDGGNGSGGEAGVGTGSGGSGDGGSGGALGGSGGQSGEGGANAGGESGAGGSCGAPLCGQVCCGAGDVCRFATCVAPGPECAHSDDCAPSEYCDFALGGSAEACAGVPSKTGRCLPMPPLCEDPPLGTGECLLECERPGVPLDFTPILLTKWGDDVVPPTDTDVMMTPIVVQLNDDDCDGLITADDRPDVVFSSFSGGAYYKQGTLHAATLGNGVLEPHWDIPNLVHPGGGLAAGDLDGDGVPEIVGCMNPGPSGAACCDATSQNTGVVVVRADGSPFWTQPDTTKVHCGYSAPAIADPLKTGNPMVLVGFTLLDGLTGAVVRELDPATSYGMRFTSFADVDGDGELDVTDGQRAYRVNGDVIWDLRSGAVTVPSGYHAVANLDGQGLPEVVLISPSAPAPHQAFVIRYDAASASHAVVVRGGVDINMGITTASVCPSPGERGGGPPTLADFDGDGVLDVGVATAIGYTALSGAKLLDDSVPNGQTFLWLRPRNDCSSGITGSSAFDFHGDGRAEVLYGDEQHFAIMDGATGQILFETCNTTGTLFEYPVVSDLDNDGSADIIVPSNAYGITCADDGSKQSGIRVFSSATASFGRSPKTWNEHTHHAINILESGAVPADEPALAAASPATGFRHTASPGGPLAAPDLVVSVTASCGAEYALRAEVRNLGRAEAPAPISVRFYSGNIGSGTLLGSALTTKTLHPAQGETLIAPLPNAPDAVKSGATPVYAIIDDGSAPHAWQECRTTNNTSPAVSAACR